MTFADLGVPEDLIDALDAHGISAPFPIQEATIPPALAGQDVCGRAPTGSGKTLAFGIPLVANVQRARPKRPRALVLVPTRELAAQVSRDLTWLGASRDVRVHAFYGGTRFEGQVKALRRGVDIAVACPGRLADLVNQKIVRLDGVDLVVVDEADRMADMGFLPEVKRLIDRTDDDRRTLLFSATLDGDVDALVNRYQHDPVTVDVSPPESERRLEHHFWAVPHAERIATTAAVINRVGPTIVFTRTRHGADRVARQLAKAGVSTAPIHGNRSQNQRERALREFRTGEVAALVATDVAARGIHVDDVTCVVHFDLPADPKDYIHRSGRTGRAGSTGVVIGLVMPDKRKDTRKLLRALDLGIGVTEPDVDALPAGEPITPPKRRGPKPRPDGAPRRGGPGGRDRHKPSGSRKRRNPRSPSETKPARRKTSGPRDRHDNRHDDNGHDDNRDVRPGRPKPRKNRSGPGKAAGGPRGGGGRPRTGGGPGAGHGPGGKRKPRGPGGKGPGGRGGGRGGGRDGGAPGRGPRTGGPGGSRPGGKRDNGPRGRGGPKRSHRGSGGSHGSGGDRRR